MSTTIGTGDLVASSANYLAYMVPSMISLPYVKDFEADIVGLDFDGLLVIGAGVEIAIDVVLFELTILTFYMAPWKGIDAMGLDVSVLNIFLIIAIFMVLILEMVSQVFLLISG